MGDAAPSEDPTLLRDDELLDFVDEVAGADPELLAPSGSEDLPVSEHVELDDHAPWTPPSLLPTLPVSGSSSSGEASAVAWPSRQLDGSPQSFATLPPWVVPDHIALHSCLDGLLSDSESGDERGVAPVPLQIQDKRVRTLQSIDPRPSLPANVATCAPPPPPATESVRIESSQATSVPSSPVAASSRDKSVERSRRRRKRQKDEVVQLRERIQELEKELERLRHQDLAASEEALEKAIVFNLVPMPRLLAPDASSGATLESVKAEDDTHADTSAANNRPLVKQQTTNKLWKRIALHHKEELRKSRFKNVRLRALAEQQLRVLKQLEIAFRSAGRPTNSQHFGLSERALHRGLFDSEAAVFESLRVHLASQYMETNRVYKASGLADFDGDMVQAAAPRVVGGVDAATSQVYLENMECKVFPFSIQAVNEAVWHCLTNSDATFHPGFYQVFEASKDIVTVKISDFVRLPQAETLVTVWLTVRRYEEDERVVTVWNAMVETEGSLNMKLHERGWNILRPLLPTTAQRNPSMCITQTVMRVSPVTNARFAVQDVAMGTLANVLIGCYHRTVVVMHHVLEKLLLTEFKTLTCST